MFQLEYNSFGGLIELKRLLLDWNIHLKFTDNQAFGTNELINLETLDLSRCNLTSIPDDIVHSLP